jgi:hypothetical protein
MCVLNDRRGCISDHHAAVGRNVWYVLALKGLQGQPGVLLPPFNLQLVSSVSTIERTLCNRGLYDVQQCKLRPHAFGYGRNVRAHIHTAVGKVDWKNDSLNTHMPCRFRLHSGLPFVAAALPLCDTNELG